LFSLASVLSGPAAPGSNPEAAATDGLIVDDQWWPLAETAQRLGVADAPASTVACFEDWTAASAALGAIAERAPADAADLGRPVADCAFAAPLRYPGKVLCAGANYYDHLAEMGVHDLRKEAQRLFFFFKPPHTAIVGPGATVLKPADTGMLDWEVELAAVFGRRTRNVSEADALDSIAAYTVAIDLSARDLNQAPDTFYKLDWVAGKAQDTSCPMGPQLVPAAFVGDPMDLALKLSVNGEAKQDARTSGMVFSIPEQIAILSRIMTLEPGDVLLTGTPAGVGFPKRTFLSVGDRVDAEIERVGALSVSVVGEI
jgi:2-keto-4-pentenoate hydratase/2-oxohepta-3-ene-1,7-dioic acid hydratase in catechol pathway